MKPLFPTRVLLAALFVLAGLNHFLSPQFYLPLMPPWLPWHLELIYISGLAEIVGGIGILAPALRQSAGWGLILLLIAVFPANVQMLIDGYSIAGKAIPQWMLIARLPLQFVLIFLVYRCCLVSASDDPA